MSVARRASSPYVPWYIRDDALTASPRLSSVIICYHLKVSRQAPEYYEKHTRSVPRGRRNSWGVGRTRPPHRVRNAFSVLHYSNLSSAIICYHLLSSAIILKSSVRLTQPPSRGRSVRGWYVQMCYYLLNL